MFSKLLENWFGIFVVYYLRLCGRFVVLDRDIYDAWLVERPNTFWKKCQHLLLEKSYPRPDLVIFLDAPAWLEQQHRGYLKLKSRIPQMVVVNAARAAEEVEGELKSLIWSHYRFRCGAKIFNGHGQIGSAAGIAS